MPKVAEVPKASGGRNTIRTNKLGAVMDVATGEKQNVHAAGLAALARLAGGDALEIYGKIDKFEQHLLQMPQVDLPIKHFLADGLYARECNVPAGTLITGEIHRHAHVSVMSAGEVAIVTENGVQHFKAPCTLVTPPGVKRVGYVMEDMTWVTIHANPDNESDVVLLKQRMVFNTIENQAEERPALEGVV